VFPAQPVAWVNFLHLNFLKLALTDLRGRERFNLRKGPPAIRKNKNNGETA